MKTKPVFIGRVRWRVFEKATEDCTHSKTLSRKPGSLKCPPGLGVRAVLCRFRFRFTVRYWTLPAWSFSGCWMLVLGIFLSGCAVGPNYKEPKTKVPSRFANADQTGLATNNISITWWKGFQDQTLTGLVQRALTNNLDLRIATANVREARALYHHAQFDLGPTINATGSYTDSQFSRAGFFGSTNASRHLELYDAGFDATWELDLFGHVRRSVQAGAASLQAAEANRRDVLVTVASEVARNYFELRGAQNELDVARRNATNQFENMKITQARLEGGRGTGLDVARAQAQFNSTLARIPPLETAQARAIHRLGVLVGKEPESFIAELQKPEPLPKIPELVAIGSPDTLLRRRPDIRIAERQLAAATARIGIEVADLFPRVTFNGSVGFEATTFSGLGGAGSDKWSFGPRITWSALDYGHVRARIGAANARAQTALATYEKTVLTALEETENALVEFGREQARRNFLRESVDASQRAATLARERFENGATDFLTVLDAERVLLEAQDQLAQSETRTATSVVALYKALGGGWEQR